MKKAMSLFSSVLVISAAPLLMAAKAGEKNFAFCFGDQDKLVCPDWEWLSRNSQQIEWSKSCQAQLEKKNGAASWPQDSVCTFRLEPDGNISDLFVIKSKNRELADTAIQWIKKAAPFKAPPAELSHGTRILVTFVRQPLCWVYADFSEVSQEVRDQTFSQLKQTCQQKEEHK